MTGSDDTLARLEALAALVGAELDDALAANVRAFVARWRGGDAEARAEVRRELDAWLAQVSGAVQARIERALRARRGTAAVLAAARQLWRVLPAGSELRSELEGLGRELAGTMAGGDGRARAAATATAMLEIERWLQARASALGVAIRGAFR